jgi:hypothetical protein
VTIALVTMVFCLTLGTGAAFANPGGDNVSTAIPTPTLPLFATGSLDSTTTDTRDVYAITLVEGQTYEAIRSTPAVLREHGGREGRLYASRRHRRDAQCSS